MLISNTEPCCNEYLCGHISNLLCCDLRWYFLVWWLHSWLVQLCCLICTGFEFSCPLQSADDKYRTYVYGYFQMVTTSYQNGHSVSVHPSVRLIVHLSHLFCVEMILHIAKLSSPPRRSVIQVFSDKSILQYTLSMGVLNTDGEQKS